VLQEPGPVRGLVRGQLLALGQPLVPGPGPVRGDPLLTQKQLQQHPCRPLRLLSAPKPMLMAPEQAWQRGPQEKHCPQVMV
jgi:hypothetical protein